MYRSLLKPILFSIPAEWAHHLAFWVLRVGYRLPGLGWCLRSSWGSHPPELSVRAFGLTLPSPIGLAAGFDKEALGYDALLAIGFGAVEVGTITAQPQPGNPRPRLFRLPLDRALLNRMGFNNCGAEAAGGRLHRKRRGIVGVNVGKTKVVPDEEAIRDYIQSVERLGPLADYLVVNVSSPNTPGLRALQAADRLRPLLIAVRDTLHRVCTTAPPPLLVKIAPDLTDVEIVAIADLCMDIGVQGIIATNTTTSREGLATPIPTLEALGAGGVSGAPLKARSLHVLNLLKARAGDHLELVAAGGIETVDDVWERLVAGASFVQIYTSLIYEGPTLPRRLGLGLLRRARAEGFTSLQAALAHYRSNQVRSVPRGPAAQTCRESRCQEY